MLKGLRDKPTYVRRQVTVVLTVVIFGIIVFSWLAIRGFGLDGSQGQVEAGTRVSPFEVVKNSFDKITGALNSATESNTATTTGTATTSEGEPVILLK